MSTDTTITQAHIVVGFPDGQPVFSKVTQQHSHDKTGPALDPSLPGILLRDPLEILVRLAQIDVVHHLLSACSRELTMAHIHRA